MKKLFFIVVLLISSLTFYSQNKITIKRKVIDSKSKSVIYYANVGIIGKPIGTISNLKGRFEFHLPASCFFDTFYVSALGYSTYKALVKDIIESKNHLILLKPKAIVLKEVIINSNQETAKEIFKKAVKNIKNNYPVTPYIADVYYHEFIQEDLSFVRAIEAAITIYNDGSHPSLISPFHAYQVNIKELRVSKDYHENLKYFINANNLNLSLKLCNIKALVGGYRNKEFKIDSFTYFNDELVYIISSITGSEIYTKIYYIKKRNYAFVKIVNTIDIPQITPFAFGKDSLFFSLNKIKQEILYSEYQSKMYPKFINLTYKTHNYESKNSNISFTGTRHMRLLFNNIITNNVKKIPESQRMDKYKDMFYQGYTYNAKFWENYNIIIDTSLRKRVYEDISKNKKD